MKVLIAGSGAIGLRTALECLNRNIKVVLKSKHHPLHPSTCSMGSGGLWLPFHCEGDRVDGWAKETLTELLKLVSVSASNEDCSGLALRNQRRSAVEIVPTLLLKTENAVCGRDLYENSLPEWTKDERIHFQHMTLEMLEWQNLVYKLRLPTVEALHDAGYPYCWYYRGPVVDGPKMLANMLDEVLEHECTESVDVDMKKNGSEFESIQDMAKMAKDLDCDAVVNCTGVGSKKISETDGDSDDDIHGARGILHHYDRASAERLFPGEVDAAILTDEGGWGTENEPCYMIPRGDKLLVGGTYLPNDYEEKIRSNEHSRLIENAQRLGIQGKPISEWTGFRPSRSGVRLEIDDRFKDVKVVHNYGHGGAGWTTHIGAAKEGVSLLCD